MQRSRTVLPDPLAPMIPDPFPVPDRKIDPAQDGIAVEGFLRAAEFQRAVGPAAGGRQVEPDRLAVAERLFDLLHLIQALLHRAAALDEFFGLPGGPAHQALDGELHPADLALLELVLPFLQQVFLALLECVFGIVPGVMGDPRVREFGDLFGDDVEQVTVVGDDQHRARIIRNEFLEELLAFHIQVIVRLIQEQQVRLFQKQFRQADQFLLAAGKRPERERENPPRRSPSPRSVDRTRLSKFKPPFSSNSSSSFS